MPMLLYGNGTISGTTSLAVGGDLSVSGRANVAQGLTTVSKGITSTSLPTGCVLQVVQGTMNSGYTCTGSFANIGLSASITPMYSTSKILIQVSLNDMRYAAAVYTYATVFRNNTTNLAVGSGTNSFTMGENNGFLGFSAGSIVYLDSPATTSSTTYSVYAYSTGTGFINSTGGVCVIILSEIAG
jgi:hypothetical protein